MDSSLKFFLIGLLVGISTLLLLNSDFEELGTTENYFSKFLFISAKLWQLVFFVIIVTTLPFIAIEPLRKRCTRKRYIPFPFLAGNGCAFLSLQIVVMIFKAIS